MNRPVSYRIVALPGDGIGPEVTKVALHVMQAVADASGFELDIDERPVGGAAIDASGEPLPMATRMACRGAEAVFLGAVGGPTWDDATGDQRPEAGLLALRKLLSVYANLRPVTVHPTLAEESPLRPEHVRNTDLLIVRELTGGIYFGTPREHRDDAACNTMRYTREEIARLARIAFERAERRQGRVTSVDKANVLEVSRLWRDVVTEVHAAEFPHIDLNHLYVDNAAMQLTRDPRQFDVILTANLFGDILSDLAATLPGSLGLLPSASIGGEVGLFEPVHGSAPDLAGKDVANPIGAILSGALLLEELGETQAARTIRNSVSTALDAGLRTKDLWRYGQERVGTVVLGKRIAAHAAQTLRKEVQA